MPDVDGVRSESLGIFGNLWELGLEDGAHINRVIAHKTHLTELSSPFHHVKIQQDVCDPEGPSLDHAATHVSDFQPPEL